MHGNGALVQWGADSGHGIHMFLCAQVVLVFHLFVVILRTTCCLPDQDSCRAIVGDIDGRFLHLLGVLLGSRHQSGVKRVVES